MNMKIIDHKSNMEDKMGQSQDGYFVGRRFIEKRYALTAVCSLAVGIIAHGMALFNKYSVHDDAGMYYGVGATFSSGRWMLEGLSWLELHFFGDGHYTLPIVNGMISILFLAASACLLIGMLDIRQSVHCIFLGSLLVSFPVITSLFGYMFTAHFYMCALFIGVLGGYLICMGKKWYTWASGTALIVMSTGVYQAYIPFVFSVVLIYCIHFAFSSNYVISQKIARIARIGIFSGISLPIYYLLNRFFIKLFSVQMTDYQGLNEMGKQGLRSYGKAILVAYKQFLLPSDQYSSYMYFYRLRHMYYITLILIAIMVAIRLWKLQRTDKWSCLLCIILLFIFPLATNLIFVLAVGGAVHSLMMMGAACPFILMIKLWDLFLFPNRWLKYMQLVLLSTIIIMYVRYDNRCYLKAEFAQSECISYFTTLITQIKSLEGYRDGMPVVYLNEYEKKDRSIGGVEKLKDIHVIPYSNLEDNYLNDYNWKSFMNIWCGFNPVVEDESNYVNRPDVKRMPHYPTNGSIQIIDDTVVVKF